MIQVSELRIGNTIKKRSEVFTIKCATELVKIQRMPVPFSPAPLTEEWLVRFGFEKKVSKYPIPLGSISFSVPSTITLHKSDGFFAWGIEDEIDDCSVYSELKYVHQLQNLYFALTGKELTL